MSASSNSGPPPGGNGTETGADWLRVIADLKDAVEKLKNAGGGSGSVPSVQSPQNLNGLFGWPMSKRPKVVKAAAALKNGGWPSMKSGSGRKRGGALGMAALGKLASSAGALGHGAMSKLAQASAPVPQQPPAPVQMPYPNAGWFGRRRGIAQLTGSLGKVFPRTFGRSVARGRQLRGMGMGLRLAAGGARAAGMGGLASGLGSAGMVAGRLGAVAGGPVGIAVAALVTAGEAAGKFAGAVHTAAEKTVESYERLAQHSGHMAAIFGERAFREVQRDQRQGERIANTARDLMRSEQDLKDNLEPIESLLANMKNTILSHIEQMMADMLRPVTNIAEVLNRAFGGDASKGTMQEALEEVARTVEKQRAAGAPEFTRPTVNRHRP